MLLHLEPRIERNKKAADTKKKAKQVQKNKFINSLSKSKLSTQDKVDVIQQLADKHGLTLQKRNG